MAHYKLEQKIIEEVAADNSIISEWLDIPEPDGTDKNEIELQGVLRVHYDIYEAYKPIDISIKGYTFNGRGISEVVGEIHKKYKFHLPQRKFILLDENSGNLLTGEIVGQMPHIDKFNWLYKSMRETVFIPMMSHCLFNITREYSTVRFYDFWGYYGAKVIIKASKPIGRDYQ